MSSGQFRILQGRSYPRFLISGYDYAQPRTSVDVAGRDLSPCATGLAILGGNTMPYVLELKVRL